MLLDMSPNAKAARAALRANLGAGTWAAVPTDVGTFHIAAFEGVLIQTALPGTPHDLFMRDLVDKHPGVQFQERANDPLLQRAASQLREYAQGQRTSFDVPMRPEGTEFQKRVWSALQKIPYGETWTYGQLAQQIGRPNAFRAVGQANHNNPLAPFIPCHRVVNAGGGLGGYGGGMELKRELLSREGVQLDNE